MDADLEKVLMARVCHDLITPINAIGLGLDTFEISKDNNMLEEIKNSTNKAIGILIFFRELFSSNNVETGYSLKALQKQIINFLNLYNILFELESQLEILSYDIGQIIMYTAIIAKEILPCGGKFFIKLNSQEAIINYIGQHISNLNFQENDPSYKNIFRINMQNICKKVNAKISFIINSNGCKMELFFE